MAIIEPHLSSELQAELQRAGTFHDFVMKTFPSTFTAATDRVTMLAAKTHLADDLYGSILYLLSAGRPYDGGAFALLRPLVEVSVEAQWQFFCASDETFRRAYAGEDVDPGLPNMMAEVDRISGDPVFAGLRAKVKTLHGFTHGGSEQLGRRFDSEGNLRANYSDEESSRQFALARRPTRCLSSIFCQAASGLSEKDRRSEAIEENTRSSTVQRPDDSLKHYGHHINHQDIVPKSAIVAAPQLVPESRPAPWDPGTESGIEDPVPGAMGVRYESVRNSGNFRVGGHTSGLTSFPFPHMPFTCSLRAGFAGDSPSCRCLRNPWIAIVVKTPAAIKKRFRIAPHRVVLSPDSPCLNRRRKLAPMGRTMRQR